MEGSLDIVRYEASHRPGLLRLWAQFFGAWSADRLQQRWAWQFDQNPFGRGARGREPVIFVAVSGGEVVGHLSGIPIPMLLGGTEHTVLAASGLVVDEAHRLVGFRLVRSLFSEGPVLATAISEGAGKLMTQCGAKPVPGSRQRFVYPRSYAGELALRIRWHLPRSISGAVSERACRILAPWYVPGGKPRPRRLPSHRVEAAGGEVRRIERFGDDYDELWSQVSSGLRWSVAKDSRYMNWRYLQCPTLHPLCLGLHTSEGTLSAAAVVVTRTVRDRAGRPCGARGEIAELLALDPDCPSVEALLVEAMSAIDKARLDSIAACCMHPSHRPVFERLGFLAAESEELAATLWAGADVSSGESWDDPAAWYYTAGDGDSLYSFGV
jgi:hypothetical protein